MILFCKIFKIYYVFRPAVTSHLFDFLLFRITLQNLCVKDPSTNNFPKIYTFKKNQKSKIYTLQFTITITTKNLHTLHYNIKIYTLHFTKNLPQLVYTFVPSICQEMYQKTHCIQNSKLMNAFLKSKKWVVFVFIFFFFKFEI